jgi:ATP-dependent Clp protease ATP-binding subunit ClpB
VFNVLLQILEDGRLTDSHGRTVNFKNTIVIMTSNIGSPHLMEGIESDGTIREGVRRQVMEELRRSFRPEFLNRVDETVLFKPLTREELAKIVDLQMKDLRDRLAGQGFKVELSDKGRAFIAEQAYDPVYGARPLKRFIQQHIETPIARQIIGGEFSQDRKIKVDVKKDQLTIG